MLTIKVIGPGCINCENLYELCVNIAAENELEADIQKITNREKFAGLGIWMTPGLIVNDKVISQGKVPTKSTLEHWLTDIVNKTI
ncbi:MAG: thioredoxin family protein [Ignavibacteriaceae bacterium]|nr:thioredoxin family protein [Ignavibacteriaceae bacterium]